MRFQLVKNRVTKFSQFPSENHDLAVVRVRLRAPKNARLIPS